MKRSFTNIAGTMLCIIVAFLTIGCSSDQRDNAVESGVSLSLSQTRRRTISELKYELKFIIPAEREKTIESEETICFLLDSLWNVQLDFRAEKELLHQLTINGAVQDIDFRNEHIILPQSAMQLGENTISIRFTAGEQSLNRREDYLYTLFVPDRARTVFPCFDQPNLKANFKLTLEIPEAWTAVTNTYADTTAVSKSENEGRKTIVFAETEPLSTYLFAFAAGRFEHQNYTDSETGRTIGAYYRETDPQRLAQLPDIFREVCFALKWQEDFTAQPYPFRKYDLVILPGFQFGGMEHTGATFYNDNTIFLPANPTLQERLSRSNLIAHETTHMWFGDFVTMDWFNDVWTKEVFANYFAAAITEPLYPTVDHDLNWLRTFQASALVEDRTEGGTAIQQPLDNLRNAGLIYNNIIYNKAPLVMRKMVELMGMDAFRRGIRRYIHNFAYGNATWDDLIDILDSETDVDLKAFSQVWVKEYGLPLYQLSFEQTDPSGETTTTQFEGRRIKIQETDRYDRDLHWPQTWRDSATDDGQILPNADGKGYGIYTFADSTQLYGLLNHWQKQKGVTRQSLLMTLNENYLMGNLDVKVWEEALVKGLRYEDTPLTAGTLVSYLYEPLLCTPDTAIEAQLLELASSHPLKSVRTLIWRLITSRMTSQHAIQTVYDVWNKADNPMLSINDYMTMSYELAVRLPDRANDILATQRQRIQNADRLNQFDFVSRAVVADKQARDSLFAAIVHDPQARRIEPWTRSVLYYLNHACRQDESIEYIYPALEALPEVQRTGDIFFPEQWCSNLLANHRSREAKAKVEAFLKEHPDLNPLLKNKIKVAAARLCLY